MTRTRQPDRTPTPWRPRFALAIAALLTASGLAQPALLPADTFFAAGMSGLEANADRFEPLIAEWNRLGLDEVFADLFADEFDEDFNGNLPAGFQNLSFFDLVGNEAWFAASVSAFNPLPAVTAIFHPSAEALAGITDTIASLEANSETQVMTEGDYTFYFVPVEEDLEAEGLLEGVSLAVADGAVILSSNPDVLRGTLRRLADSDEPSFEDNERFIATQAAFADSNFYTFVDFTQAAAATATFLTPLAAQLGFESVAEQLVSALSTAGVMASSSTFTDTGLRTVSVQSLNAAGGDDTLYALLSDATPANLDSLSFVPADALTISVSSSNPTGWWDYLNGIVTNSPELGLGSLDEALEMMVGVDLRQAFFNWAGNNWASAALSLGEVQEIGMPSENLLGEMLIVFDVSSEAEAQAGLDQLVTEVTGLVSAFSDPFSDGEPAAPAPSVDADIDGVRVRTTELTDGVILSYAVVDGYALLATDATSVAAGIQAHHSGKSARNALQVLLDEIPTGATTFAVTDTRAVLESSADSIASQVQILGALSGSEDAFEQVESLSSSITDFFRFVAARAGDSVGYKTVDGNEIHTESHMEFDW